VTVPLPADLKIDAARWALGAALVNPHATITVIDPAYSDDGDNPIAYKPAGQAWSKWTPSQPSNPHWYDQAAFAGLVGAYLRDIARTGVDRPLGQFISEFEGLSGSTKQRKIRQVVPGITHLSQLAGRDDLIAALHTAMRVHAKNTPPARLGPVGEDHFKAVLGVNYWVVRFWYKDAKLTVDGVPWIIEVAVAETSNSGDIFYAVNHSPSFGDPLGQTWLDSDGVCGHGTEPFFNDYQLGFADHAAVVHVICAATQFIDKGKIALVVPDEVAAAAAKALAGATKTLRREAERRRKDAVRADRARARERRLDDTRYTIKDAVFEVLPEAKEAAGRVCAARTLWYKVRPLVQKLLGRELDDQTYQYFSQTLLPEYERTVGPIEGLYYKDRGKLYEPHSGRIILLGTREVEDYIPPDWEYDKVLYVEKDGLYAQLAPYEIAQRYDMGMIFSEGYSVTACRELLADLIFRAQSAGRDLQVFVLHDADIGGYNIARTLGEPTKRMPEHNIDVIDLGLTAPQAVELGLETETFTRQKALPSTLRLDPVALEWFTGEPFSAGYGKTHHRCIRCELNAFSADGLAAFIEAQLERHGVTKLVPPAEVLAEHVVSVRDGALTELVTDELLNIIDVGALVRQLITDNPGLADITETQVRDRFTNQPAESWRAGVDELVHDTIDTIDGFPDQIRDLLAQQLRPR
jgi:hypothetical protein